MNKNHPLLYKPFKGLTLLFFAFFAFFVTPKTVNASHVLGGEIAFRCIGNGQYVFTIYIYRACDGIPFNETLLNINHNVPGLQPTIACNRIAVRDVSPDCAGNSLNCGANPATGNGQIGAIAQIVFESAPVDFSLIGPAPVTGYIFHTITVGTGNIQCCRNSNNNTACGGDMALRAIMYPFFLNGVAQTPAQLCDRSPFFAEPPAAVGVVNAVDTAFFNNNAIDRDLDATRYYIDEPWSAPNTICSYNRGFSVQNPFPGIIPFPGNKPIDELDGSMIFLPNTQGRFVVAIRVESYREGQKIAEIYRDFQLTFIAAPANYPPNQRRPRISAPFPIVPGTIYNGYYNRYYAGEPVTFSISVLDTSPSVPPQLVKMYFNGLQFGANNYTDPTSGCPFPPCATLSNASGISPRAILNKGDTLGFGYQGLIATSAEFLWNTDCGNIPQGSDGQRITDFQFVVTAVDDQCPAPGKTIRVVNVNLLPTPQINKEDIHYTSIKPISDSRVRVTWRYFDSDADPVDTFNMRSAYGNPPLPLSQIFMAGRTDSTVIDSIAAYISIPRRRAAFQEAFLYRSTSPNGPFVQIASFTNYGDNNFVDTGLDLTANTYYYAIRARSGCFNTLSDYSDIVTYITPRGSYDVNSGIVSLNWNRIWVNAPSKNFPYESDSIYRIEELYNGAWRQVATTLGDTFVTFRSLACDATAPFRVIVNNIKIVTDTTVSRVVPIVIFDNVAPPPVAISNVTIDASSRQIIINWQTSTALDVDQYYVYKFNPNITPAGYQRIGIVPAPLTSFVDLNSDPSKQNYYRVAAIDYCKNEGLLGDIHSNMAFSVVDNRCNGTMDVRFSNYVGANISRYEIFRTIGGAIESLVYTSTSSIDTFFVDAVQQPGEEYCYIVNAFDVNNNVISNTLRLCKLAGIIVYPDYNYIRKATVQANGSVLLQLVVDPNADILYYLVERSNDGVNFAAIGQVGYNNFEQIAGSNFVQINYVDNSATTDLQSFYYRMTAVNDCEQLTPFVSNTVRTIFLEGDAKLNYDNPLIWNEYESFLNAVATYNVFRRIPFNEANFRFIGSTFPPQVNYLDNIIDIVDNDGQYCYQIQAIEQTPANIFGLVDTVYSNVRCVTQEPRMFVPNAFSPDGIYNPKFYPQGVFVQSNVGYNLTIWDRLGNLVFESNDINEGWDGSVNGVKQMNGVYVYALTFTGNNGQAYNKRGVLTLIR